MDDDDETIEVTAKLNGSQIGETQTVTITTVTRPATIASVSIVSYPGFDDSYGPGDTVEVAVVFSEAVNVTGRPRIQLRIGGGNPEHLRWANYASGTGTTSLRFTYVVQAADMDDNGIFLEANELELNGATIRGAATGLDATLNYNVLGQQNFHKVNVVPDTSPPAMGPPRITGTPLVGEPLTVDISGIRDDDGLTNARPSYEWIRIEGDGDEPLLGHARERTYRPTVHDLGSRLRVVVRFTDDGGHDERRTSEATERITAPGKLAGDFDLHSSSTNPRGIWGNDETIWVANSTKEDSEILAYSRATRQREPHKDFSATHLDALEAGAESIYGIWSDGTTMYAVDTGSLRDMRVPTIYAYSLDDKSRDEGNDITLASGNSRPRGMWGNAGTIWVVNSGDLEGEVDKVFAYRLTDDPAMPANEYGAHDPDQDFDTLEADGEGRPTGIWSDGTTMWVVDQLDRKAYAYAMSDRSRLSDQDITLDADNELSAGAWGDIDAGEMGTLWAVDNQDKKLYAYPIRPSLRSNDGLPIIIGTPMVGQTLTVDTSRIGDPQGLPEDVEFRCRWDRVVDGRDLYINQSWNCSYTVPWRYVGLPLKVEVSFHDARGAFETRRSDATDPVARGPIGNDFDLTIGGTVSLYVPNSVWGNKETIWVSKAPTAYALTDTDNLLFAYNRSDGSRIPGQDIPLQNRAPGGIWSDGKTMFVVDSRDDKIYAYNLDDRSYDPRKDIDLDQR